MALPTPLSRPPITEALVDLRAPVEQPQSIFEAFATELADTFPDVDVRRGMKTEWRIEQGKLVAPVAEDLGFQGVWLKSRDGTQVVQARPDGFTFNNLATYIGGDTLIATALEVWSRWVRHAGPVTVTRVALRYLNRLELPLREGDDFRTYLTAAPEMPPEAPQSQSEFLTRVVAHDEATAATVIVTQRLRPASVSAPPVLDLDIDAFTTGNFPAERPALREILETLRMVKNRTFFSLLTDRAVGIYL